MAYNKMREDGFGARHACGRLDVRFGIFAKLVVG